MPKSALFAFLLFLTLLLISSSLLIKIARAEDAFPKGAPIPCEDTRDPEYSSDRPYQASPCGEAPVAMWCGSNVVIDLGSVSCPYVYPNKTCVPANPHHEQTIDVDLTDVELPILGNTELTKNSQNSDELDDGTKVSEYVAWYLGGANARAETPTDPATIEGLSQIVNYSGPLKKLLPSIIQDSVRINTINAYVDPSKFQTDSGNTGFEDPQNHNQIVVCKKEGGGGFFGWIQDVLNLGKSSPVDCSGDAGKQAGKGDHYRLSDWDGDLSWWNSGTNLIVDGLSLLLPSIPKNIVRASVGDHWNLRTPPLPWSDEDGKPFKSDILYQKAYNEWKGKTCVIVPGVNWVICIDNIFVPNRYADLFQYVPLANTTDKIGEQTVTDTEITAPRAQIVSQSDTVIASPELYLAHTLEDYQLSNLLKSTYLPTGGAASSAIPADVEDNSKCRVVPSRSNPGDDATFSNPKSHIRVTVKYDVGEITCSEPVLKCNTLPPGVSSPPGTTSLPPGVPPPPGAGCRWEATCQSEVYAKINSVSKTPYVEEIWKNTVAGADSIFRRIYPKTGVNSPVNCIADIPASSNANYTLGVSSSPGLKLVGVTQQDGTSVTSNDGKSVDAQLYYPHLGSVSDYFLKGIQQALRPKGYGEGTPESGQYCENIPNEDTPACGELPKLPKGAGSCNLGGTGRIGDIPQSLKDIISAASATYRVPPNLILAQMYGEGAFNEGKYNWTDQNVKNWATCQKMPNCNESGDDTNLMGFQDAGWAVISNAIEPELKKLDLSKKTPSKCNLIDAVYGAAWNLNDSADGSPDFRNPATGTGYSCLGHTLNTASNSPTSCTWDDSQYETAIRNYEFGLTWGSSSLSPTGIFTCGTADGSCFTGGVSAQCPTDTVTNPDTCAKSGNNSHNLCVWEVAHGQ